MNKIDKLLLLALPLMDVGIVLFGVPIRIGEFLFILFLFRLIDQGSFLQRTKLHAKGFLVAFFILANLVLVLAVSPFSNVDTPFFLKYVARNALYFMAMTSFIIKPIQVERINADKFIKYILYTVTVFYLLELIDYYLVGLNWDAIFVSRQNKHIFRGLIIRFSGPSSEPAFIVPLLSITLMYGFLTKKRFHAILSIILILLTFSSFGYLAIAFSVFFFFRNTANKEMMRKVKSFAVNSFAFILLLGVMFADKISTLIAYNWTKIQAYFRVGDVTEWSASQRTNHVKLAFNLFADSPWYRKLWGNGTGYYSKMSRAFDKFYLDDAEEAHSLYVSTLTDRGIIGLLLILILFFVISRIRVPKNIQGQYRPFFLAIKFGVLVKIVHWMFTGMVWQYYFWVEVVLLLSLSMYYNKKAHERR